MLVVLWCVALKVNIPLNHSFSLSSSSPLPQVPELEGKTDALQVSTAAVGLTIIKVILPVSGRISLSPIIKVILPGSLMLFLGVSLTGHPTSCTTGNPGGSWRSKIFSLPFLKTFSWKGCRRSPRLRKGIRISSSSTRSVQDLAHLNVGYQCHW